jgi:hypothetical protein
VAAKSGVVRGVVRGVERGADGYGKININKLAVEVGPVK